MNDISKHYGITLNTKGSNVLSSDQLLFNYGDDITIDITIVEDSANKNLSQAKVDLLLLHELDDVPVIHRFEDGGISISNNVVTILCKSSYINKIGVSVCQLIIRDEDQSITTQMFSYKTNSTLVSDEITNATDKIDTLVELDKTIENCKSKILETSDLLLQIDNKTSQLVSKVENEILSANSILREVERAESERVITFDGIKKDNESLKSDIENTITNVRDGVTPNISIGNVTTLDPGLPATVVRRGNDENPIFDFGVPKGVDGFTPDMSAFENKINKQYDDIRTKVDTFVNTADELGSSLINKIDQATVKNTELKKSLEETKKYIDGLDESQNIPQLALDINELKEEVVSKDHKIIAIENTLLEGSTPSIVNYTVMGRSVLGSDGQFQSVHDAVIGIRGGRNLWNRHGEFNSKYEYNLVKETLTNGISLIPNYNDNGEYVCKRGAIEDVYGQRIKVRTNTDYVVCYKLISAGHGILTIVYGQTERIKRAYDTTTGQTVHKFNTGNNSEIIIGFCNGHGNDSIAYESTIRDIALYEYDSSMSYESYVYEDFKDNNIKLSEKIPTEYNNIPLFPLASSINNHKADYIMDNILYKNSFEYSITGDEVLGHGVYGKVGPEQIQLTVEIPFLKKGEHYIFVGNGALGAVGNNINIKSYTNQIAARDQFLTKGDGVGAISGYGKDHLVMFALSYKTIGITDEEYEVYDSSVVLYKFREWLKLKNIVITFALKDDIKVPLKNVGTLFVYENAEMYIEDVNGISPTMSFYYNKSLKGSINSIATEVEKIKLILMEHADYLIDNDFRITMLELGL